MTLWKTYAKENVSWIIGAYKSKYRVLIALCLFILCQSVMLLILNLIPIGDVSWAAVCREWIENYIG